jgi:hypothetical protein
MESPSTLLIFVVIAASIGLFGVALLGMVDIFKRRKEKVASFRAEPSTGVRDVVHSPNES